jgi:hypothetical protein
LADSPSHQKEPIAFEWPAFSTAQIAAFEKATASQFTAGNPPTLGTIFRMGEFQWLDRLKVDMRRLLHTEQEYEYVSPIRPDEKHQIVTSLDGYRERRGMAFVTLVSTVKVGHEVRLKSTTQFVLRPEEGVSK